MSGSCVLMYHAVSDSGSPCDEVGSDDPVYTVTPDAFRAQLQYLDSRNLAVQSLQDHLADGHFGCGHVCMTFDDGNRTDALTALPLLQKYGFAATFYITTQWVGRPGFLDAGDIRTLHAAGMEIGSHGHSHKYFDDMSAGELADELAESTRILNRIIGGPVRALGAPGGRLHPQLSDIARSKGIDTIATSRFDLLRGNRERLSVPRVAVLRTTSIDEFRNMVDGDPRYYRRKRMRHAILQGAKKLLGNRRYERLRSRLLRTS